MERGRIPIDALYDSHLHSHWSPDASDPFDAICRAGLQKGLAGITLTDHCDCGPYGQTDWRRRLAGSLADATAARAAYADRLWVGLGVELGQPLQDLSRAEAIRAAADYDVILGSLHNLSTGEDFFCISPPVAQRHDLLSRYFDELIAMVEQGGFDALTHLTYPYRYLPRPLPPTSDFEAQLRKLFGLLVRQGIALELNTSGRRSGGEFAPGLYEFTLYRDCGGRLATLGSDAHCAHHVAGGLAEGAALLRQAGFTHYAVFERRAPRMVAL